MRRRCPQMAVALAIVAGWVAPAQGQEGPAPLSATRAEDLREPIVANQGRALLRTPSALHRFQVETETWMTLSSEEGLPPAPLQSISLTGDDLWVTGTGASLTDPQVDDWQYYGPEEGYPGRVVFAVAADDDYAYAATDGGLARFDRYILEWEPMTGPPDQSVKETADVEVDDERTWFAFSGGVIEYRKDAQSYRVDTVLGQLEAPEVLALRQTTGYLWAVTTAGLARYDKSLETWTGFLPGVDLPDARIHDLLVIGEDLYLACDDGIWHFLADQGIWRRDEACGSMPGRQVFDLAIRNGYWVVTDRAFAYYDEDAARWIDFTTSVPAAPQAGFDLAWVEDALLLAGPEIAVYALHRGESNPSLYTFRTQALEGYAPAEAVADRWRPTLDEGGLGLRKSAEGFLLVKGGATVYIEDDDNNKAEDETDFDNLISETRYDLTLSGRFAQGRALSGYYDTTNPDDETYLLSYRGTRDDILRNVSAGELDQQFFNTQLNPELGLRGGSARLELGPRSEETRRRWMTADAWAGERRTFPGRKVFYGPGGVRFLGRGNLIPNSEEIRVDRELLAVGAAYTIDWESGFFIIADHILIDDNTAIEVTYLYEEQSDEPTRPPDEDQAVYAGQIGFAPGDHVFAGVGGTSWTDEEGRGAALLNANSRLEWKGADHFIRLSPEIALTRHDRSTTMVGAENTGGFSGGAEQGLGQGLALQGRYRGLELSAQHRSVDADFVSLEDRQTLLGRMREESSLSARWNITPLLQSTLDWSQTRSDQVGEEHGLGDENLLMAGLWLRRAGFPNLGVRRGRVWVDSLGHQEEKWVTRGELELDPDPEKLALVGIRRLWMRAFFQRNERSSKSEEGAIQGYRQVTDHSFIRLNGSAGNPLSWNLDVEDRWTHRPEAAVANGLSRDQRLDASFQLRPHSSVDAFLSWDASRDLTWREVGGTDGFKTERRGTLTSLLYPGRIAQALTPLSFRVEVNHAGAETGEAGLAHPDIGSLSSAPDSASEEQSTRAKVFETRLQLLSWLRFVDRIERGEQTSRGETTWLQDRTREWEHRFEIKPRSGLLSLRYVNQNNEFALHSDSISVGERVTRRAEAEWSQLWGRGWLTYVSLEAERSKEGQSEPLRRLTPQARLTLRRERFRTDASVGLTHLYEEALEYDAALDRYDRHASRSLQLDFSFSIQPLRILTLKLLYQIEMPRGEDADHDIDLRLMVRA